MQAIQALALGLLLLPAGDALRAQVVTADGELLLPERRMNGWVVDGADRSILELTYSRINSLERDGPGGWSYEWMQVGRHYERKADELAAEKQPEAARDAYLQASLYYAIGYFPENHSTSQRRSYEKHLAAYLKASRYLNPPMEVVRIPFEGKTIVVYLHRPRDVVRPRLVLWTGGSDWWKASYHRPIRMLVDRGVAVAAFDIAGTGESTAWTLTPDSERLHLKVLEHFAGSQTFGRERALVGVSFGGYFAVKIAARNRDFDAVVNYCGLVHHAFVRSKEGLQAVLQTPEGGTVRAAFLRSGIDVDEYLGDFAAAAADRAGFSLLNQGIVGAKGEIRTPLLNVNGSRDPIAPVSDTQLIEEASPASETWWLGTSGHCAPEYRDVLYPQMFDWLLDKLGR